MSDAAKGGVGQEAKGGGAGPPRRKSHNDLFSSAGFWSCLSSRWLAF